MNIISEGTKATKSGYKQTLASSEQKTARAVQSEESALNAKTTREVERNNNLEYYKQRRPGGEFIIRDRKNKPKKADVNVEPVFAYIKSNRNFKRFTHRGFEKLELEFGLHTLVHNIRKKSA